MASNAAELFGGGEEAECGFLLEMEQKLIAYCEQHEIAYDEEVIRTNLKRFAGPLEHRCCFIQLRTAAKTASKRALNWRYELRLADIEHSHNNEEAEEDHHHHHAATPAMAMPWNTGNVEGEFPDAKHQLGLIRTLAHSFPTHSIGVDFDTKEGLCKLWHFGAISVEKLVDLVTCLPGTLLGSLIDTQQLLESWGHKTVYCTGVDLFSNSMNIYFRYSPLVVSAADVLNKLGFTDCRPSAELLSYCEFAAAIAFTFSWNKEAVERVCFYIPTDVLEDGSPEAPQLAAYLKDFQLPTSDHSRPGRPAGFVGCSFSNTSSYLKLEYDFKNQYYDFLSDTMVFNSQHPSIEPNLFDSTIQQRKGRK